MDIGLGWEITVVNDSKRRIDALKYRDDELDCFVELKNAMLYGTSVTWLPLDEHNVRFERALGYPQKDYRKRGPVEEDRRFVEAACKAGFKIVLKEPLFGRRFPGDEFCEKMPADYYADAVRNAHVLMADLDDPRVADRWWDPHSAAHLLMREMSKLIVPDVGYLPLDGIIDIREKAGSELDGVRAEMLRLTTFLRTAVGEKIDLATLQQEALVLISTRLEPVVREADLLAKDQMKSRWRKFLVGGAKALGFAGFGVFRPDMFAKAVDEVVKTADVMADGDVPAAELKRSARFVLEARRALRHR